MFKTIKIIVLATLCLNFSSKAQGQNISATIGEAISNAVIKIIGSKQTLISDDKGALIIPLQSDDNNLKEVEIVSQSFKVPS